MANHPVAKAALDQALDLMDKGATLAEAAQKSGVSERTLKRRRAEMRKRGDLPAYEQPPAKVSAPAPRVTASSGQVLVPARRKPTTASVQAAPVAPDVDELPDVSPVDLPAPSALLAAMRRGKVDPADLLPSLHEELAHAMKARRAATAGGIATAEAKWSKRVEELVRAVAHLTPRPPPPPMPPDLVEERLRQLDGETIALIELHLSDKIDPKEIAA